MKHVGKKEYAIIDIQRQVLQVKKELKKLTDLDQGLCRDEVDVRIKEGQYNVQPQRTTKSYRAIIYGNLFTLFNLINVVLALLVFFTGNYRNMLFMGVVASNLCIGIFQEIRSKRVLDRLSLLSQGRVKVIRNAAMSEITVDQIVMDDLLILENGNQIPCDAVVRQGKIECNESLVSGESDIIPKTEGNFLYSGSFVVSGKAVAQVCAVGNDTYVQTILGHAKQVRRHPSQLRDAINFIIKCASIVLIPLGVMLFAKQLFLSHATLNDAITATVAGVVGMIPEGLVLLTSVALAVGVITLARRQTLVQELYCIETLARVDLLCFDKTGTLTEGTMRVEEIISFQNSDVKDILAHYYHDLEDNNATAQALRALCPPAAGWNCTKTLPFSSSRKASAVAYDGRGTYLIGAYEFLFSQIDKEVKAKIDYYADQGKRVVVLAHSNDPICSDLKQMNLTLLALLVLSDPIRPQAADILDYFYQQGVDVKIISGDDVKTVHEIARQCRVRNADAYVDASKLNDAQLEEALETNTVFGRVSPMQKKNMIRALKAKGHVTAMSGDGVNDVMALKEADCSIAMAQGSEAAKNISNLVLLDSDFAHLPQIVDEGRRVINNIQRTASLFLVKTTFSVLLSLLTLFFIPIYPFEPIQLTLISTVSIGMPSFFLALEANHERIKGNFLFNVFKNAIPGALCVVLSVLYVYGLTAAEPMSREVISTMCVLLAGFSSLAVLFHVCCPFDRNRLIIFIAMCALFLICINVEFLRSWFMLKHLSMQQLLYVVVGMILIPLIQKVLYRCSDSVLRRLFLCSEDS